MARCTNGGIIKDYYNGHEKFYVLPGMRRPFRYKGFDVFLGWKDIADKFAWIITLEKQHGKKHYIKSFAIKPKEPLAMWKFIIRETMGLINKRIGEL